MTQIIVLNRFVARAINKCLPFFKILRKAFEWTEECQIAFEDLNEYLMNPPLLNLPIPGETLYLYLAISDVTVSTTLVRDDYGVQ